MALAAALLGRAALAAIAAGLVAAGCVAARATSFERMSGRRSALTNGPDCRILFSGGKSPIRGLRIDFVRPKSGVYQKGKHRKREAFSKVVLCNRFLHGRSDSTSAIQCRAMPVPLRRLQAGSRQLSLRETAILKRSSNAWNLLLTTPRGPL
jgi:hypothetical protein